MSSKLDVLIELLQQNNKKLDKLCALISSATILQETISPEGEIRGAEEIGELLTESYLSAIALDDELDNKTKQYNYHMSEFFIGDTPVDKEKRDEQGPPEMQFN